MAQRITEVLVKKQRIAEIGYHLETARTDRRNAAIRAQEQLASFIEQEK